MTSSPLRSSGNLPNEEHGQLFISVRGSKWLGHRGSGAFCVLQLDNQQIQTRTADSTGSTEFSYESWDEGYTFDITSLESQLFISVYAVKAVQDSSYQSFNDAGIVKIGYLLIPMMALSHKKPIDQWFNLKSPESDPDIGSPRMGDTMRGEIHLKIHYTTTMRKIGPEDFQLLKVVGKGAFGKVMMVKKKDSQRLYAMKVMNKDYLVKNNVVNHILSEKNILKKMSNPFVVSLKYSFQTEDKLHMIMDYVCGGELFFHLCESKKFTEDRARFYAAEIVLALEYVHNLNIIYRDLKPENLLLDMNGHVCLTDFGMCKEGLGYGYTTHTFCGSPEYLAPEILLGKGYSFAVDWWAYGTLLYEMLCGMPPYYSEDTREMNQRIVFEQLSFPHFFSQEARSILTGLLERDPNKRLGSGKGGAQEIKSHAFFKGIDWSKMQKKLVQPPFRPNLKSEMDVRFFDPDSTQETAAYSFKESQLTSKQQDLFAGFSYVAPDAETHRRMRTKTNEFLRSSYTEPRKDSVGSTGKLETISEGRSPAGSRGEDSMFRMSIMEEDELMDMDK